MIDRQALLKDLQRLLRQLEADLRARCDEIPEVGEAIRAEYDAAREAERTALAFEAWRADTITQIAVAWVLSCVFARFLEDNGLVDPPRIAGPDERLRRARDEHELYFSKNPTHTDREYLLSIFDGLAELPGGRDVFGPHNAVHQHRGWLSGDAAKALLGFFQRIEPESGRLVHDFADDAWDTRFLGDLYQDLSEAARKKYALLQTPEFVEEFILDRTLDPAVEEFGLKNLRMIDPACGSGHFLLGSFRRLFDRWCKAEPGTNTRELVQRSLSSIHGVDINPFAVAIARFRLLLASLRACDIRRLADSPGFAMNLACGDSLYHGRETQMLLPGIETEESHYFRTEDAEELGRILREGTYHCVVANPPYITPKDKAANNAYRRLYATCHMKYSLAVPFMERIFRLAIRAGDDTQRAGYTGQITSNSFMKREFGKKLIETFLPTIHFDCVIDTSGAYIPGHGTPTVILLGRNRTPLRSCVRTVMGILGEPSAPSDPRFGRVWLAIVQQIDSVGSKSEFVSVADLEQDKFYSHPWSIGGGGAAELKESLDSVAKSTIGDAADSIGITSFPMEDPIFLLPEHAARRHRVHKEHLREMIVGDAIRDWVATPCDPSVFPYTSNFEPIDGNLRNATLRYLWIGRTVLANSKMFGGKTKTQCGMKWFEFGRLTASKLETPLSIAFSEVATHNHFYLDRGGKVFKNTVQVIKLPSHASEGAHLRLLGLLNSAVCCFWLKQVSHNKGSTVDDRGARQRTAPFEDFFQFNATKLQSLPLPSGDSDALARQLDAMARQSARVLELAIAFRSDTEALGERLAQGRHEWEVARTQKIALQEELDWECYTMYGLADRPLNCDSVPPGIELGQRAFEIVMARKMAAGQLQTTWFERHGSTPITELPADWPEDYRRLVERRIEVIESNPQIALIEQPEYKRRWNTESWESQQERALRNWLLDRLESYFDFDGRMNDEATPTAQVDVELVSVARLADLAARDGAFMEAAELFRSRRDFDVGLLVAELVREESVPLLPVLRYKPSGLDKRKAWERTWELQRLEDAIDARTKLPTDHPDYLSETQAEAEKVARVGDIPVPPKYKSSDFISTGGAKYWRLRGKLDVPKERWVSFPHCEGEDQTLVVAWAGYDHLQLARAVAAYFAKVQEELGGSDDPRLVPLLAGLLELIPWLKQWHNDVDPEFNMRMGDYFEDFVEQETRTLGMTVEQVRDWQPPKKVGKRKKK